MKRGRSLGRQELTLVLQLLRRGLSIAEVAAAARIHRRTVERIAAGRHYLQRKPTHHRCNGCGGMVILPCRRCSLDLPVTAG